jgi:hypothetical protein
MSGKPVEVETALVCEQKATAVSVFMHVTEHSNAEEA